MQKDITLLYRLFSNIQDEETCSRALDVILSDDEQNVIADRLYTALLFEEGNSPGEIAAQVESSAVIMSKIREALSAARG